MLPQAEVFQFRNKSFGMHCLNEAMNGGHDAATYAIRILLFGELETQELGTELLNELTKKNPEVAKSASSPIAVKCRIKMLLVLTSIAWIRRCPVQGKQWMKPMCGRAEGWGKKASFCSELCRWSYEYNELYLQW